MHRVSLCLGAVALVVSSFAVAAPADDAKQHIQAVAAGNVDAIMATYGDKAHLEWVGGPLNGAYSGSEAIRSVWTKFAKANAPLEANVAMIEESANPAGATVSANVELKGKNTIKVRYILTYREGKLVSETWQIDPKLTTAGY